MAFATRYVQRVIENRQEVPKQDNPFVRLVIMESVFSVSFTAAARCVRVVVSYFNVNGISIAAAVLAKVVYKVANLGTAFK